MKRSLPILVLSFCVCLIVTIPAVADIVVGLPADSVGGNCLPFGCGAQGEYQQVYTSSLFSGPITITNLEFFNTITNSGANYTSQGNWIISLSTTSKDWNSLSSTFSLNIGNNSSIVFNGNLYQQWAFGDALSIQLSTPFTYDPSQGNLLMDVQFSNNSPTSIPVFYDGNGWAGDGVNGSNTIMGRVYGSTNQPGTVQSGYGLVTGFSTAAVPEPITLIFLGTGLIGLLGFGRKFNK